MIINTLNPRNHIDFMQKLLYSLLLFSASCLSAQETDVSFTQAIAQHRQHYKEEFITEPRSPLTAKDTALLDFFPADASWNVQAVFTPTPDAEAFDMPTYSGKTAQYRQYGVLQFEKNGAAYHLNIYQNLRLLQVPEYKDYLFIPFKDPSNGEITYGGGRYIECRMKELVEKDGKILMALDFNKCFNPYCAYSDGYNCPVPPRENHLSIVVAAGERNFKGEKKH